VTFFRNNPRNLPQNSSPRNPAIPNTQCWPLVVADLFESDLLRQREAMESEAYFQVVLHDYERNKVPTLDFLGQTEPRLDLWKTMLQVFQESPPILFHWNLYVAPDTTTEERRDIWRDLCELSPHPMWEGDISWLRYYLQKVVQFRITNHGEPASPLSYATIHRLETAMKAWQIDPASRNQENESAWNTDWTAAFSHRPELSETGQRLLTVLRAFVKPHLPTTQNEMALFYLTGEDVKTLRRALDYITETHGSFDHSTHKYYIAYKVKVNEVEDQLAPRDIATMVRWEEMSLLNRRGDECGMNPLILPRSRKATYTRTAS
jgi:hypothetical protein